MSSFNPNLETECVGCGGLAVKYCEGWDHSKTKDTGHGSFSFSEQCGYPVCDTCEHVGRETHRPLEKK